MTTTEYEFRTVEAQDLEEDAWVFHGPDRFRVDKVTMTPWGATVYGNGGQVIVCKPTTEFQVRVNRWEHEDEVVGFAPHNGRTRPPVLIRRWYEAGLWRRSEVFVGGWRAGIYKTEAGARRRAEREVDTP